MARTRSVVLFRAVVLLSFSLLLAGCEAAWWAGKKVARQEAQEVAERSGLSRSKEELREDIREARQSCDRDVADLEKKVSAQKEDCARREAELKKQIADLKEAYSKKQAELEKALEKAK